MKIVFIPSVQHTGTHFLQALLGNAEPNHELIQITATYPSIVSGDCIMRDLNGLVHVSSVSGLTKIIRSRFVTFAKTKPFLGLVHAHFAEPLESFISFSGIEQLAEQFQCVVPIREPLRVLISRMIRAGSHEDVSYLVHAMSFQAKLCKRLERGVFTVPIDLVSELPPGGRTSYIDRLFHYLGLNVDPDYLESFGLEWPFVGTYRDFARVHSIGKDFWNMSDYLIESYENRDKSALEKALPMSFPALVKNEKYLRPYLQNLGYENLIWWS